MKEAFKKFVQKNPQLISYVNNQQMTWQQFYEMYDLYGEDHAIWNNFKDNKKDNNSINSNNNNVMNTIKDFLGLFKGIDLNKVQKALSGIDKAIEAFKGLNSKDDLASNQYEERPKYKYFED